MFQVFFNNIAPFLLLILIGYISKKTGLLKFGNRLVINKLITNLTLPVFIFNVFCKTPLNWEMVKVPFLSWIVMAGAGALAFISSFWIKNSALRGGFLLVTTLGNTGYFGYPLTVLFYGERALSQAVFYDVFGTVVFTFTLGLLAADYFGRGEGRLNIFRELFTFPPMIALIVGLIFNLGELEIPRFLSSTFEILGEASIPLIMVSIGLSLEFTVSSFFLLVILASLIKLIFSPLLAHYLAKSIGLEGILYKVSLLEASMPSMMLSLIIGERYSLDTKFIASAIFFTTLFSFLTIPLIQSIFN